MPIKSYKIEKYLQNRLAVRAFDEIDSTNNEAKRRADADKGTAVLYVTDCQTAGRGRHGHDFYSPKGSGLYFTLSLPVNGDPADIQTLTCAAAVAVCEAVEALSDKRPQIKWVNDVYLHGRKVAGILTELATDNNNQPTAVIIGIGINLTTKGFPAEFAERAGSIGDIEPERLCAEIADRLTDMYEKRHHNSFMEKYRECSLCLGRQVSYTDTDGEHTAKAVDIADDGSLIVEENGVRKALRSGEISVTPETLL